MLFRCFFYSEVNVAVLSQLQNVNSVNLLTESIF